MKEEFLHYIWKYSLFNPDDLLTVEGEEVEVVRNGDHHHDAGADFQNARIWIGDTLWVGNVEIHFRSSDWRKHGHDKDPAYSNVILHVVLEHDEECLNTNGEVLPTLELQAYIPHGLAVTYDRFLHCKKGKIPCEGSIQEVDPFVIRNWIDRLVVERLERKVYRFRTIFQACGGDRRETFHVTLARYFGGKVNAEPFERLARSLSLKFLLKHRDSLFTLEALLFGQAGLLTGPFTDKYPKELLSEFTFLQKKYGLVPMEGSTWRFMRARPGNFPTIRIAQFASVIHEKGDVWAFLRELPDKKQLEDLFSVNTSEYWKDHFIFDKRSGKKRPGSFGKEAKKNIFINAVAPFIFFLGMEDGEQAYKDQALDLLRSLSPEDNRVVRKWKGLGVEVNSAWDSQGLLELMGSFCKPKKCLNCPIGNRILKGRIT